MSDAIQNAIAQAQAAAAASTAAAGQALAPAANSNFSNFPSAPLRPGKALSMDDMGGGGIQVDSWMGVNEYGLQFGEKKSLVTDPVRAMIDLTMIAPNFAMKFGNPAEYLKSYDGITEVRGGSWADAQARADRASAGKATVYRSCDVPMVLVSDVKSKDLKTKTETVVAKAGDRVGYSISTTGYGNWESFYKVCASKGLQHSKVMAELTSEPRTNRANNNWGVIAWKLVEETAAQTAAA